MKKIIVIASLVALVLVVGGYLLFARGGGEKYEFKFDQIKRGDLAVNVTATGTINAVTTVEVGTQVSGVILKLYADYNSIVKEGQLIAQIDPTFLKQAVRDAEANLLKAQTQLEDSKRSYERIKSLFERKLEAQENLDATLTTVQMNQAALQQAEATLDRAKINLSYATIYAPIDGVVIDRKVNVGQTVAASFSSPTLYTIAQDLREMQVETTVDESDIGKVSIGQMGSFTVDAYPEDKFTGKVAQIRLAPVSVQNVVNYIVIIEVDNDELKLMPGMTANVKILVAQKSDVLLAPNMALRFRPPEDLIDSTKTKGDKKPTGTKDSLKTEFKDVEGAKSRRVHPPEVTASEPVSQSAGSPRYGITRSFPEYQKGAYLPERDTSMGKLWVLNKVNKLEQITVRTGLTDGKFTEILETALQAGEKIVTGVSINGKDGADQKRSPLTGSSSGPRPGRPF